MAFFFLGGGEGGRAEEVVAAPVTQLSQDTRNTKPSVFTSTLPGQAGPCGHHLSPGPLLPKASLPSNLSGRGGPKAITPGSSSCFPSVKDSATHPAGTANTSRSSLAPLSSCCSQRPPGEVRCCAQCAHGPPGRHSPSSSPGRSRGLWYPLPMYSPCRH